MNGTCLTYSQKSWLCVSKHVHYDGEMHYFASSIYYSLRTFYRLLNKSDLIAENRT